MAAAALIPGEVTITSLDFKDSQGDKRIIAILQEMGAEIETSQEKLIIRGGQPLHGLEIDCKEIPDLLPTLAVLGTFASGQTSLVNAPQARLKETDRLHSMAQGLSRLGAKVEEKPDGLIVHQSLLKGAEVHGFNDHRTVMALALAGMLAQGQTVIDTAEAVNKTFPGFVKTMQGLGAKMVTTNPPMGY